MSELYKHKRYYRIRRKVQPVWEDTYDVFTDLLISFSDTNDAQTKIGFKSCYTAGSPTTTYALADSNTTLVVTYEFDNATNQTAFKDAIDAEWGDYANGELPWNGDDSTQAPEHFKTEWLHKDGSVSNTTNDTGHLGDLPTD